MYEVGERKQQKRLTIRTLKARLHVRRKYKHKHKHKHKKLGVNRCDASISALCLSLCLCYHRPGLHVRHNNASINTSTREWNDFNFLVLVLVLMLASLRRTCKSGRHKHKTSTRKYKAQKSTKLAASFCALCKRFIK